MRKASIHIYEEDLLDIIIDVLDIGQAEGKKVVNNIMLQAKNKPCNSRSLTITNQMLEKKAKTLITSSKGDANLLAEIIYHSRKKRRSAGIKKVDQDSREWNKMKELTKICVSFCNEYGLSKRKGFIEYVKIGFSKISSFNNYLGKLINMDETIYNLYNAKVEIMADENPEETREIHDYYVSLISKRTNIRVGFDKDYLKYLSFLAVRKKTDELNIPAEIFIDSQFEGLSWTDNYPEPSQLISEKSIDRLNKYLYNNKLKISKKLKNVELTAEDKVKQRIREIKNGLKT